MIDGIIIGFEDAVGESVVAHKLPDIRDRVKFGPAGRQRHEGDIGRHYQFGRAMPPCLIEYQNSMRTRRDVETPRNPCALVPSYPYRSSHRKPPSARNTGARAVQSTIKKLAKWELPK